MKSLSNKNVKKAVTSLSVTSLMDVLTIILLFLLVNYSEQQQEVPVPKSVALPKFEDRVQDKVEGTIDVVVETDYISIEGKEIPYTSVESDRERIISDAGIIFRDLKLVKEEQKLPVSLSIKADRDTEYQIVDTVIAAAATENITKFELVALATK